MSHLTVAPCKILDLEALRTAAASFGATMEKAATFTSYNRDRNKCEHRIKLPGVSYQIGVIKDKAGHYVLSHDPFGYDGGGGHDGHKLVEKFGDKLGLLTQRYAVQVVALKARAKGWMCQQKTLPNGSVQLQMIQA